MGGERHLLLQVLANAAQVEPGNYPGGEGIPARLHLGFEHIGKAARRAPAFFHALGHCCNCRDIDPAEVNSRFDCFAAWSPAEQPRY